MGEPVGEEVDMRFGSATIVETLKHLAGIAVAMAPEKRGGVTKQKEGRVSWFHLAPAAPRFLSTRRTNEMA